MVDDTTTAPVEPPPRTRKRVGRAFALAGVVVLLFLAGTAGWLSSENALRYLLDYAVSRSGGRIAIEEARGSLLGEFRLARVSYRDGATTVVLEEVTIDYRPRLLIGGRLVVRELVAERMRVDVGAQDDAPVALPDSIVLPLDLAIERLAIERVDWRVGARTGILQNVALAYAGDRKTHRVRDLDVAAPGLRLTGTATIATARPFASEGAVALVLVKPHPEGRIEATVGGSLEALDVHAKSNLLDIAADARAKLAPFASQPFIEASITARDVDLKRLDAQWPATRLALAIEAKPGKDGLAGRAQFENAIAGTLDAGRLPITQARSAFGYVGDTLALTDLSARLHGGGSVEGSGNVNVVTRHNRWQLKVAGLDLARLHTSLRPTTLAGRIDADVTERAQRVVADLAQKDLRLVLDARYQDDTLVAERLFAQARGGTLEGKGRIGLAGARPFEVDFRASRFDPARFGDFPAGALDGTILAKGTASPALAANLDVVVAPGSRFAGVAAQGRVRGRFTRETAQSVDADVTLGANRVQATGAIGRPADRLALKIAARRLAELATLVPNAPQPLTGSLEGTATFNTRARGGAIEADLRATQLAAGRDWGFAALAAQGRATHDAPLASLRVDALRDVDLKMDATDARTPAGNAKRARASVSGSPDSHALSFALSEGESSLEGRASGQLASARPPFVWRGRIESLAARGVPGIPEASLASPATLEVSHDRVLLGAARVEGSGAVLDIERVNWQQGALDTRGRLRNLPIAPFLRHVGLADRFPTDLVITGAWDVRSQPDWRGTLEIARERGDVYIDDQAIEGASRIALGLETLTFNAKIEGRRVAGHAEMRARLGGSALADFELVAPAGSDHPFTAQAPLKATVRADLPSLAVLQPWVGTSVRVQGQLNADVAVAGTLGTPTLSGKLVGSQLRVDMPQYGLSYKDGQLRIASGPDGLRVEELSFIGGDGRFVASGLVGLPREGGSRAPSRLEWRAENFRMLNRPDFRLIVDGAGTLGFEDKRLVVRGKLSADEGNIEYRSAEETTLADDIVVVGRERPGRPGTAFTSTPVDLDLALELGRNLRFAAEGLDTRLAGRIQIVSKGGGPILGTGTIRAVRGTYWAFGQRLEIERGRIVFAGPLANPSLDIVALRKNLAVEAGVEISGTVRAPLVRLTSNPPVPDSEKLAWLLTGGPSGSASARDAAAMQAAAAALLGKSGKPFTQTVAQRFGLDDISVAQRTTVTTDPVSGQVVTLGKRITDKLYVAYEQGLTIATNALRVEYALSRFFTLSAFAGTQSGVALNFRRAWR